MENEIANSKEIINNTDSTNAMSDNDRTYSDSAG